MESTSRSSVPPKERPWLEEKVYDLRRSRTVEFVKNSVAALLKDRKRVSLAAISARSKAIDPDGRGISESAILKNQEARTYYEQHRSWRRAGAGARRSACRPITASIPARIKIDRDAARVRYRYQRLNKAELIERLLAVEQAHALLQEQWFQLNEEMLDWRLRVDSSKPQLRRGEQ